MRDRPAEPALHEQRCSFCRASRAEVRSLILGPSISICNTCTQQGMQIVLEETAEPVPHDAACSFCRKARSEVGVLVSGPESYICDDCLQLCGDILAEAGGSQVVPQLPMARVRQTWWKRWIRRG